MGRRSCRPNVHFQPGKEADMSLSFPSTLKDGQCVLVPVDVKQNKSHPPSVHCAPVAAAEVTDDRVLICKTTAADGTARMSFRFASELGGIFGAGVSDDYRKWHNEPANSFFSFMKPFAMAIAKSGSPDTFSRYRFELTGESLYLTSPLAPDAQFSVDDVECVQRAVASALGCWGYSSEQPDLIGFANTVYSTKLSGSGTLLPNEDRIARLIGRELSPRDSQALTIPPDIHDVPLSTSPLMPLEANLFNFPTPQTVRLDVKANDYHPPNVNFAPIRSQVVTNDEASIWTRPNADICVRFKSEVGGVLGALADRRQETFSSYDLCIIPDQAIVYAEAADGLQYRVDLVDRAALAIASALGTLGYTRKDFGLKHLADHIYADRARLTTMGIELPQRDKLANQTLNSQPLPTDAFALHSEMVGDFCRWDSPSFSLFRCIGVSTSMTGL